ncbi:MAG: hypothetical protein ABF479_14725, partial [Gluconacetobacter sp.]
SSPSHAPCSEEPLVLQASANACFDMWGSRWRRDAVSDGETAGRRGEKISLQLKLISLEINLLAFPGKKNAEKFHCKTGYYLLSE